MVCWILTLCTDEGMIPDCPNTLGVFRPLLFLLFNFLLWIQMFWSRLQRCCWVLVLGLSKVINKNDLILLFCSLWYPWNLQITAISLWLRKHSPSSNHFITFEKASSSCFSFLLKNLFCIENSETVTCIVKFNTYLLFAFRWEPYIVASKKDNFSSKLQTWFQNKNEQKAQMSRK